jgi:DNA-binding transcriptional MerR regulator
MAGNRQNGSYTSRELASLSGVSADTIRHYERLGLLEKPIRTQGGYRLYPNDARDHVQTIRCALKAGFSLAELASIFKERDAGGAPCNRRQRVSERSNEFLFVRSGVIAEVCSTVRALPFLGIDLGPTTRTKGNHRVPSLVDTPRTSKSQQSFMTESRIGIVCGEVSLGLCRATLRLSATIVMAAVRSFPN